MSTQPDDLCQFEVDVLRAVAGEDVPGVAWGAAMSVALECLSGRGLIHRPYHGPYAVTDKGRARLAVVK